MRDRRSRAGGRPARASPPTGTSGRRTQRRRDGRGRRPSPGRLDDSPAPEELFALVYDGRLPRSDRALRLPELHAEAIPGRLDHGRRRTAAVSDADLALERAIARGLAGDP